MSLAQGMSKYLSILDIRLLYKPELNIYEERCLNDLFIEIYKYICKDSLNLESPAFGDKHFLAYTVIKPSI